jgi:hypothetical protein
MNPKERIQKDIEGLEGLLIQALRIQNPKYIREIRKDIEGLQRELRKGEGDESILFFYALKRRLMGLQGYYTIRTPSPL